MIIVLGLLVIVGVGAIWVVMEYNGFIKLRNIIDESFSTMDVYLKKRYDLIPNLVETVKGYAAHEAGTLEKVVEARNMAQNSKTITEKAENESALSGTLKSLFAIAEAYPDLKANTNFMDLQSQLRKLEEDIANARKYYNGTVKEFNTKVETFPSNLIAGFFKFTRRVFFEVETVEERENVKVQF